MTFEFRLPDIGEGVTEGEIVAWHVRPGDRVEEDAPMVDVMTDKATVTIGAPRTGVIRELRFDLGQTAAVGSVLVVFGDDTPAATAVGDIRDALPATTYLAERSRKAPSRPLKSDPIDARTQTPEPPRAAIGHKRPLATPATRKLARDLGVDLRRVPSSDPSGRVTRDDVRRAAGGRGTTSVANMSPSTPQEAPPDRREPFVGLRRKIAERMQAAKNTAAHYTFVEECHCDRLVSLRSSLRERAERRGAKLSYLPFIVKAVVGALKRYPVLNSMLDDTANELVFRHRYDIGIATATDAGLVVPVVRNADRKTLLELALEIERLAEGARAGTLGPSDLSGSTFTITSLGRQGGLMATPVLNLPEVGILGVHRLKQTPVVRDGQIVIGHVMLLSLSMDHRLVDGHVGAAFAYEVIDALENPESLLLDLA